MWNRPELKEQAKAHLKKYYWNIFLVCIVLCIAGGINITGPFKLDFNFNSSNTQQGQDVGIHSNIGNISFNLPKEISENPIGQGLTRFMHSNFFFPVVGVLAFGVTLFVIVLVLAWTFLLGAPLIVGCHKYFLSAREDQQEYKQMAFCFNNATYWNVVKTMFMRALYTLLWTLLLIIPGIIKAYSYSMVPFLMASNPNLSYKEAIDLSNDMTVGHKWDMFVLDLSFIGWYLLGLIACGLGGVFVNPYYLMTKAELYIVLRDYALEEGMCTYEQLLLDSPVVGPLEE